jgi:DNA-binding NarL/FixJ family response regulator
MTSPQLIDSFLNDLFVSGALLDGRGRITEVSEGWRQFARSGRLKLPDYGIGEDYLKYAVFPDAASAATLRGLQGVLKREVDVFSTIYPCETPSSLKWFLLVGLAVENSSKAAAAVLHIDISSFLPDRTSISASMIGIGPGALDPAIERVTRAVRQAIATGLQNSPATSRSSSSFREHRVIKSLTSRELELLAHLAQGLTNSAIAKARNISIGTAKNQTTALLKKLGVANRTQAAIIALGNGVLDETC